MSIDRILVVDDDPSTRFLLRLIFEAAGYEVTEAQHGVAALIRIKDVVPDLIVTDMMMPVMDGGELIEHLRADPLTAELLILAVSANPDANRAAAKADLVMGKPFHQSKLLENVASLLEQGITRKAAACRRAEPLN